MAIKPISVSQLNEYIARVIRDDLLLSRVTVRGEVSNVRYYPYGAFFALTDPDSRISCFLPSEAAEAFGIPLENGMAVSVDAYVNVRVKRGDYNLQVREIWMEKTEGNLAIAFQKRKEKLDREGIFAPEHKQKIPFFPSKVGIVTSANGAAVRDILRTIKMRNDYADLLIFPVPVQGEGAGRTIAGTIDRINREHPDVDVLIVGRGGGSQEDLWEFNDEELARSIYRSHIPVISGVGHEIDTTICDMAADLRAATPTAAAQAAVPDTAELREAVDEYRRQMLLQLKNSVMYHEMMLRNLKDGIQSAFQTKIRELENGVEKQRILLEAQNPNRILASGYSVLSDEEGRVMLRARDLQVGGRYQLRLAEGSAECEILRKDEKQ